MAIETLIDDAFRYEDFAFFWEHADQADVSAYDLCFELMADFDTTPLVSLTIGAGITLAGTPNYRATIALTAADLVLASGPYVWTVSRRNVGAARVLSFGAFVINEPRVGRVAA